MGLLSNIGNLKKKVSDAYESYEKKQEQKLEAKAAAAREKTKKYQKELKLRKDIAKESDMKMKLREEKMKKLKNLQKKLGGDAQKGKSSGISMFGGSNDGPPRIL